MDNINFSDFRPAPEVINYPPISLYIKKMSGDFVNIKYDNEESLERVIEREILNNDEYNGYMFNLFREDDNIKIDEENLKEGDIISIILYPKTFNINFIFIEESVIYKSDEFKESESEKYKKYVISIRQNNNNKICLRDHLEFCFYYKRSYYEEKDIYIPSYRTQNINTYSEEEDFIYIKGDTFSSFRDMIKDFLSNIYCQCICDSIIEESDKLWNL